MPENLPNNEQARLAALRRYHILGTLPEQVYDDIAFLASQICQTPIALITLVDEDREWFKARVGLETTENSRDISFCSHAILEPNEIFTVTDAACDKRFADNPFVTGAPNIRFYAGTPLVVSSGEALGTLCVIDREPRSLTQEQQNALLVLARQVVSQLELRHQLLDREAEIARQRQIEIVLRDSEQRMRSFLSNMPTVGFMKDAEGRYVFLTQTMERLFNLPSDYIIGKTNVDWLPPNTVQMLTKNDRAVFENNEKIETVEIVVTPNGESTHWLSIKFPFTDSTGHQFVGGIAIDISERVKIEQLLRESEARARHLFEDSQSLILSHDLNGKILSINPAAAKALSYQPEELVGKNIQDLSEKRVRHLFADLTKRLKQFKTDVGYITIITKTNEKRVWKYHDVLHEPLGKSAYVIAYSQDVTDLHLAQKRLQNLSITDELTGLYNLRGFQTLAEQAAKVARRNDENCFLLYADVDDLKQINDLYGHDAGSQMIVETANLLKYVFRDSDIIARIGGDEFTVLMMTGAALKENEIKERLQKKIDEFNCQQQSAFKLSLSVGIIPFKINSLTLEEAMRQADTEMYQDKKRRRMNRAALIHARI